MKIEYKIIKDAIYNTIIAQTDNRFVFNHADRFVNQIYKSRHVKNPPFPVILIYKSRKTERHEVLGYAPTPYIYYNIRIVDRLPNSQEPDAIMAALGLSGNTIKDFDTMEDGIDLTLTTLEEWLRGDETVDGKLRRKLGIEDHVGIAIPTDANWGIEETQNMYLVWVDLTLEIRFEKMT